ncbi:phosphoribosylamine--glycine ligase [Candidatus Woesearchaeota archaeon]|nr:phosphoribosylamine--glycine ligase [Candidatus Woesearchaeota archaeon]
MTNILLIGNGAREHAIAKAAIRSREQPKLFSYMKSNNPGIAELSEQVQLGSYSDLDEIRAFAQSVAPDFAVIGPEDPLNNGVVDSLEEAGIPCVGPKRELARLETSKSFTRLLMKKHSIEGNPEFCVFESIEGIEEFLDKLDSVVIKPDGLTGGKGVRVQGDHFQSKEEALTYCKQVLQTHPAVVVEEKLDGEEFSLQCFTDGITVIGTPPCQDHKRAYEGDKGPNTGGMGSYSDSNHLLPFLKQQHVEKARQITLKVARAIKEELGEPYRGVMYGGFIITKKGVKLIEYNARMGDPEAMNVLPIMQSDFVELCRGIITGNLKDYKIKFNNMATVCKYAVPEGYPVNPLKGEKVSLVGVPEDIELFYASVDKKEDGLYMSGSRAVAFVGIGSDLEEAEVKAENAVCSVKGKVFHRGDIGKKELIQKRIRHMRMLLA